VNVEGSSGPVSLGVEVRRLSGHTRMLPANPDSDDDVDRQPPSACLLGKRGRPRSSLNRPRHVRRLQSLGRLLGVGQETLPKWVRQAEIDQGPRPGTSSEESAENKRLRRENAELRRANAILKAASAFFAAELDWSCQGSGRNAGVSLLESGHRRPGPNSGRRLPGDGGAQDGPACLAGQLAGVGGHAVTSALLAGVHERVGAINEVVGCLGW